VSYVGADEPRLGVFVVDAGGEPRVVVGPVAHAYERHERGARLNDETDVKPEDLLSPWSTSYETPALPFNYVEARAEREPGSYVVKVQSDGRDLGRVQVEEVDVHDRTCGAAEVVLGGTGAPVHVTLPVVSCDRRDGPRLRLRRQGVVISEAVRVQAWTDRAGDLDAPR
jgi:hypothetical protein